MGAAMCTASLTPLVIMINMLAWCLNMLALSESKITCGHRSFSAHFTVMSGQLRSRLVMLTGQLFLIVNNLPMQRLLFDYC